MGSVYLALDRKLDRHVALKVLETVNGQAQQRFQAEASALARLNHPGITTIYELFQHDGLSIMVMEFVRGQTLEQLIEQEGAFQAERAAELCLRVLEALSHAHGMGIVHCDLKPSNLIVTDAGVVKIMDFGIARLGGMVHLTNDGFMIGTPAYMAPEQIQGQRVDARADVYALGIVFYRLVTGGLPFQGETPLAMAQSHLHDAPTPIDGARSDVPAWVPTLVDRALAKAPEDRYQSALEFHRAFVRSMRGLRARSPGLDVTEIMAQPSDALQTHGLLAARSQLARSLTQPGVEIWSLAAANVARRLGPLTWTRRRTATVAFAAIIVTMVTIGGRRWTGAPDGIPVVGPPPVKSNETTARSDNTMPSTAVANVVAGLGPLARSDMAPNRATASAIFTDVRLLIIKDRRTSDQNVRLRFSADQLLAVPEDSGSPVARLRFDRIAKATYVRAPDPLWDRSLAGPATTLDVSGLVRRSRRWFVVQTPQNYAIFRLDGDDWFEVLRIFEDRTGVLIDRPLPPEKTPKASTRP
jgi:hypothetical protein